MGYFNTVVKHLISIDSKLDTIIAQLVQLNATEVTQMATIQDVQTEVTAQTDVIGSAVTLMNGLSQQLKDALASNDPAAVQAVVDQLDANTQSLADAVTANTPAAP